MNKWVYFLLIALLFLSGCRHSPSQTETQPMTTATENPTTATDTETIWDSIPVETQPTEATTIPETGETPTNPETKVTAAPTTQLQETTIPESTVCSHINTTIVNEKAATEEEGGYTGDIMCLDCDELIASGRVIPPLNMVIYTGPNGMSYTVEKGTNISDYTDNKRFLPFTIRSLQLTLIRCRCVSLRKEFGGTHPEVEVYAIKRKVHLWQNHIRIGVAAWES